MGDPEHKFLLEQKDYIAYNSLAEATAKILFKTNGVIVYITLEDKFYYWKESLADWIELINSSSSSSSSLPTPILGIVNNGLLYSVPAGYILESFLIINATNDIDISLGTVELGNDIINASTILGGYSTILEKNYSSGPGLPGFNIYISAASWIGISLDIYIIFKKII